MYSPQLHLRKSAQLSRDSHQLDRHQTHCKEQVQQTGMLVQNYGEYRPNVSTFSQKLKDPSRKCARTLYTQTRQNFIQELHGTPLSIPCKPDSFYFNISTSRHMITKKSSLNFLKTKVTFYKEKSGIKIKKQILIPVIPYR